MKLTGHIASLVKIQVLYCPSERIASVDEEGVLKIWNIGRSDSGTGELVQTVLINLPDTTKVVDMNVAFDQGK